MRGRGWAVLLAVCLLLGAIPAWGETLPGYQEETGYTYVSYETEPYEKKGFFSRWK